MSITSSRVTDNGLEAGYEPPVVLSSEQSGSEHRYFVVSNPTIFGPDRILARHSSATWSSCTCEMGPGRFLGEVLSQQEIGVFIGAAQPRTLRVAKVMTHPKLAGRSFKI